MKILVACEYSGRVRDAFVRRGHNAISSDLLPTESPGPHYQGNVLDILLQDWDMIVAFPPCTYLTSAGSRWWPDRQEEQQRALDFARKFFYAPCPRIAIENPVGKLSTEIAEPNQIIQPWQFGHPFTKATCLWLKGLPLLRPTHIVKPLGSEIHRMSPSKDRSKKRSLIYQGIADAMAEQWG